MNYNLNSYKHYISFVKKHNRTPVSVKITVVLAILIVLAATFASTYYYYFKNVTEPQLQNESYLTSTAHGLSETKKSFDEILNLVQIAGVKSQNLNQFKDTALSQDAFYADLNNHKKILALLASAKKNIKSQKNELEQKETPQEFTEIKDEALVFYSQADKILAEQTEKYTFSKDLLLALGPYLYEEGLTDESIWKVGNQAIIIEFYQKVKEESAQALIRLTKLSNQSTYREIISLETSYLENAVILADSIVNTLSVATPTEAQASNLESSYQKLVVADQKTQKIYEDLQTQKQKLLASGINLNEFAKLLDSQDAIIGKFTNLQKLNSLQNQSFLKLPKISLPIGGLQI